MKLSDIYSYPLLSRYEGLIGRVPVQNKHTYFGIEVEAENIKTMLLKVPGSWKVVEDGSLKVEGMEFVTVPIKLMYLEVELNRLFSAIPNASFSPRTSIHAHMNVRDLTMKELELFLILYMVFEKCLYAISGDRFTNNYCVPIYEAPYLARHFLTALASDTIKSNWSKYHGLNLTPIWGESDASACIGTAEFRHMQGTNSVTSIMNWCDILSCLKSAAKKMDKDTLYQTLVTHKTSDIMFVKEVFGSASHILTCIPHWQKLIQDCTSKTKWVLAGSGKHSYLFGTL